MKRLILAIAFGILVGNAPISSADLTISTTAPKAGEALTVSPNVVSITASAPLADQGNLIVVNDPNGQAVDDGSIAINGSTAIVGMKPITITGVYTVTYTLVSTGNPDLSGTYTFMYNAPGSISSPTAQPTNTSNTHVTNGSNAASNAIVYFLLFLAALVAIFLAWYARTIFGGKPRQRTSQSGAPTKTVATKKVVTKKAPVKKATKRTR
jgi:methionine-rich copper-binding protein CopC